MFLAESESFESLLIWLILIILPAVGRLLGWLGKKAAPRQGTDRKPLLRTLVPVSLEDEPAPERVDDVEDDFDPGELEFDRELAAELGLDPPLTPQPVPVRAPVAPSTTLAPSLTATPTRTLPTSTPRILPSGMLQLVREIP